MTSSESSAINNLENSKSFPRRRRNLVGLLNQGGTCYLNSLLQTLFHTPEFTYRLFNLTSRSNSNSLKSIIREMLRLFYGLMALKKYAISSKSLTDSFGWNDEQVFVHQDVQELNRLLFEEIELSLKGSVEANLINDLYRGILSTKIQCLRCNYCSEREDEYLDVNLAVLKHDSVEMCLRAQTATERLTGENQYFCENCNGKVDAIKATHFKEFPPILTLCLSRFDFDPKTMESIKVDKYCSFPITLDVSELMEFRQHQKILYDLFSILIHVGNSTLGGHYHAYIKDPYGFENDLEGNENNIKDKKFNTNSDKRDFSQICTGTTSRSSKSRENDGDTKISALEDPNDSVTLARELDQLNSLNMIIDIENVSESSSQSGKKANSKFSTLFEAIKNFWTGSNNSPNIAEISTSYEPELNSIDIPVVEIQSQKAIVSHQQHMLNKKLSNQPDAITDQFSHAINTNNNETFNGWKAKLFDSHNKHDTTINTADAETDESNPRSENTSQSKTNQSRSLPAKNKMKFQSTSGPPKLSDVDSKFDIKSIKTESSEKRKVKSTYIESGRWFDFNDESITEIKTTDFPKLYQGPECAYMLFYRNANLVAPGY